MNKLLVLGIFAVILVTLGLGFLYINKDSKLASVEEETKDTPVIYRNLAHSLENIETVYEFPTPAVGTEELFWDYVVANNNNNIIITKQEATCDIYATYRQCQHEFQFLLNDGTNVSLLMDWTTGVWDTDFYNFDSSSPTILTFSKIKPSAVNAKYSTQFNWKNRTWIDILYDEYNEPYNNTIIIPYREFYNWNSINLNQVKRMLLKNSNLFV